MLTPNLVAQTILILSLVIAGGLMLGSISVRGLRLGSAGVLFVGLAFAHFGARIDHTLADFIKDFGLALFVFVIGLQLGTGFLGNLRRDGLRLNALALAVVALGSILCVVGAYALSLERPGALGILAGATTNTPSLAAAQQAVASLDTVSSDDRALVPMAYAVAYPAGIVGIIAALALLRLVFRIDPAAEAADLERQRTADAAPEPLERRTLLLTNPALDALTISQLPDIERLAVRITRLQHASSSRVLLAHGSTPLRLNDRFAVVGTASDLDQLERLVGTRLPEDLASVPGDIVAQRVLVTRSRVVGQRLDDLHLGLRLDVKVTRLTRAGVELAPFGSLRLQFGDVLLLVGQADDLARAAQLLGNAPSALNETRFMPIFLGLALGVLLGLAPIPVPGLPAPVHLGLAAGPLLVALALSRIGAVGPIVWYVPRTAQLALRELGITLFLAGVGLKAGEHFFETAWSDRGLRWLALGAAVAIVPPLLVGVFARAALKLNYATLSGLLAGSMTDPPALAFANTLCRAETPSLAYATVYPITMVVRIVLIQVLALAVLA
jgi:putative transport protein